MLNNNQLDLFTDKKSAFPTFETTEDVIKYGVSKLPITSENELINILGIYLNTVAKHLKL